MDWNLVAVGGIGILGPILGYVVSHFLEQRAEKARREWEADQEIRREWRNYVNRALENMKWQNGWTLETFEQSKAKLVEELVEAWRSGRG